MVDYVAVLHQPVHEWSARFGIALPFECPEFIRRCPRLEALYRERSAAFASRSPEVTSKRPIVEPHELDAKERALYDRLVMKNLDEQVLRMHTEAPRVSGRILDSLVTKYPRHADAVYYVSATGDYLGNNGDDAMARTVDLGTAYKAQIRKYSKNCFDPFGRGHDVLHPTRDGGAWMLFSLCKFMFHRWAERNCVYRFLDEHYDEVARIQREDQQPKAKRLKT